MASDVYVSSQTGQFAEKQIQLKRDAETCYVPIPKTFEELQEVAASKFTISSPDVSDLFLILRAPVH